MKFVFFRFRRTEKMDSVMKGQIGAMSPPQNFWARTTPTPSARASSFFRPVAAPGRCRCLLVGDYNDFIRL